jgi:tetratricopeptide (TPR) repeat protein
MVSSPTSIAIGRFKQLALRDLDTWQGGVFRLPVWVDGGPGGRPSRPWGALWVSERTGLMHLEPEKELDAHGHDLALTCLLDFAHRERRDLGGRAARLRVADSELASYLEEQLQDSRTTIEVVAGLPAVDDVLRSMAEELQRDQPPSALDAPRVTVDRLRAFADAAAAFFAAAPWEHLQNDDLIVVSSPKLPRGMSRFSVMGHARINHGLAFFDSRAAFEEVAFGDGDVPTMPASAWSVHFRPIEEIPIRDADAWDDHRLPVAGDVAYPFACRYEANGVAKRPDARELNALEALLRALAVTTEAQLDAGEWSVDVTAFDGPLTVAMSLPLLLESEREGASPRRPGMFDRRAMERAQARMHRFMESRSFASIEEANAALAEAQDRGLFDGDEPEGSRELSDLERAQELVYDAAEASGRLRVKRARQAIAISPDCADAWTMLAEAASRPELVRELYEKAVAAGERALGPEAFESLAGHFWGHLETRPYMRARLGLAWQLGASGEYDAAAAHALGLLRLNPNDNQGVRYSLLIWLFVLGRGDDEIERLLGDYLDDPSAEWRYGAALNAFRRHGDSPESRRLLDLALRANPHVVEYLLEPDEAPASPESYSFGSAGEAASCADAMLEAFEAVPGSLEWLRRRGTTSRFMRSGRRGARRGARRRRR